MGASRVCLAGLCTRILILICAFVKVENFCYNKAASVTFQPIDNENKNNSYFGYSVSLRAGSQPLVVIGAPRASSLYISHIGIKSPGAIYFCYFKSGDKTISCPQRYLDTEGNSRHPLGNGKSYHHKKDGMWLGMAMDGSDDTNGTFTMCAPRWINQYHSDYYLQNGLCYSIPNTEPVKADTSSLIPLVDQYNQGFLVTNPDLQPSYGVNTYFYAYGEAGMSVKQTADGKELLIGAPGVYIWTGTVIKYKIIKQANGPDYFIKSKVPNPFYTSEIKDSSYFGYSVDSGIFLSEYDTLYVAGAPRASYKGKVFVFEFPIRENGRYIIHASLEGEQFGSYFGSSLSAVDLNSDGLTDLVIGAPLHTFKDQSDSHGLPYDQGKIYVYINKDKGKFTMQTGPEIAGRMQNGARFGSTISVLGDINKDGFKDIAIGAPYEEFGAGAVYIYLGNQEGLNPTYSQRISFADSKGLGISISRGVDIDGNGCNDIAVGSFLSNKAYLIKCHPIIKIIATITTPTTKELPANTTEFDADFCLRVSGRTHSSTKITVKLSVDPVYRRARLSRGDNQYEVNVHTKSFQCTQRKITIEPTNKDFSRPIELVMEFDLSHDPTEDENFCAECPVFAPDTNKKVSLKVPLASGCGVDMICQPDLRLTVKLLNSLPYVIGSSSSMKLNISVVNIGEPAFLSRVTLYLPERSPLTRIPPTCHLTSQQDADSTAMLTCDLDNPLLSLIERYIIVEIDTKSLKNSDKYLEINVTATSVGEEVTPENNHVELRIALKSTASIEVFGETTPSQYIYVNADDGSPSGSNKISHNFEVLNHGPTSWESVIMRFYIPVSVINGKHNLTIFNVMNPKTSLNMQLMSCHAIVGELYEETEEGHSVDIADHLNSTSRRRRAIGYDNQRNEDSFRELSLHNSDTQVDLPDVTDEESSELSGAIYVNCSSQMLDVRCLIVECEGGPLVAKSAGARVSFPIKPQLDNIGQLFEGHNNVIVSSHVIVEPKDEHSWRATTDVTSIFVLQATNSSVPGWVIAVSLICGILVLILISYALYKFGFFHRKTREELQLLKNQDHEHVELKDEHNNSEED